MRISKDELILKEFFKKWNTTTTVSYKVYKKKSKSLNRNKRSGYYIPNVGVIFNRYKKYMEHHRMQLQHTIEYKSGLVERRPRWTMAHRLTIKYFLDKNKIELNNDEQDYLNFFFELPEIRNECCKEDELLVGINNVIKEQLILKKLLLIYRQDKFELGVSDVYEIPDTFNEYIKKMKLFELKKELDKSWRNFQKNIMSKALKILENAIEYDESYVKEDKSLEYSILQLKESHRDIQLKRNFYVTYFVKFLPISLWAKLVKNLMPEYFTIFLRDVLSNTLSDLEWVKERYTFDDFI